MPAGWTWVYYEDDHCGLASNSIKLTDKQPCIRKSRTPSDLIWICKSVGKAIAVLGEQVRMALGDVTLPLIR